MVEGSVRAREAFLELWPVCIEYLFQNSHIQTEVPT